MSKKLTFRRFVALIIDLIIVAFIVGAFSSLKAINPTLDKYNESYDTYYNYIKEMAINGDSNSVLNDETVLSLAYDVSYYGRYSSVISLVVLFLYFGLFQYYTGGKTVGKLAMRIQVKSVDGELRFKNILIRILIINSLFTKLLTLICLFTMSESLFNSYSLYIQIIDIGLLLVSAIMIVYRDDGVGLHDKLANTIVTRIEKN